MTSAKLIETYYARMFYEGDGYVYMTFASHMQSHFSRSKYTSNVPNICNVKYCQEWISWGYREFL